MLFVYRGCAFASNMKLVLNPLTIPSYQSFMGKAEGIYGRLLYANRVIGRLSQFQLCYRIVRGLSQFQLRYRIVEGLSQFQLCVMWKSYSEDTVLQEDYRNFSSALCGNRILRIPIGEGLSQFQLRVMWKPHSENTALQGGLSQFQLRVMQKPRSESTALQKSLLYIHYNKI